MNSSYLHRTLTVHIDRPLGSKHPKFDWTYPLNYGEIPDTLAPDGDPIDAYVIGPTEPLTEFTGTCIAIIHRLDDNEDKLVIVDDRNVEITDDQIRQLTHFQEQYFKSQIIRQ